MNDLPPYGGGPPPGAPPRRRTWLISVLVLAVVFVLLVATLGGFLLLRAGDSEEGGPAVLRQPVRFLAVQASEPAPCRAGLLADPSGGDCLQVGAGMTVGRVADIRAQGPDPSQGRAGHIVAVTFVPDDARTFTAMTAAAARAQPPANRIAIVAEGRVLSAPAVAEPISGGTVQISGPPATFTRDYTEDLVRRITGR